jgi:hypothetical protein
MASLGMVLEQYPDEVICYVTDPRTGVQRKSKWPPTISEVVEDLDAHVSFLKRKERFENWGVGAPMIEAPKEDRPTLEELKAKYGKDWGLDLTGGATGKKPVPAPTWDAIVKMYSSDPSMLGRLLGAKDQ